MHRLEYTQIVPVSREQAWDFFSDPGNLPLITPPGMGFRLVNHVPRRMYPGMIITYRVKPLLGIALTWVTEITHVRNPGYFVDEQRLGPYRLWHHQHHFREVEGGTEIRDIIDYALPLALPGRLINKLFVRPRLEEIFRYRSAVISSIFDKKLYRSA